MHKQHPIQTLPAILNWAFACLLSLSAFTAADVQAQAINGRDIYWNVAGVKARPSLPACASCHTNIDGTPAKAGRTSGDITGAINANTGGMKDIYGAVGNILTNTDLANLQLYLANPSAVPTPRVAIAPAVLSYPATLVGMDSAPLMFTLSHDVGSAAAFHPVALTAQTISGANAGDYRVSGGTCSTAAVAVGSSCTIQVIFKPLAAANLRAGALNISFTDSSVGPSGLPLVGTANAVPLPTVSLSATSIAFGSQVQAAASGAQSITVSNSGSAALSITSLATSGANAAEFTRSGSCSEGGSVAAGSSCTISYVFTPAAIGARAATLTIVSNNPGGNLSIGLSGTGTSNTPTISLTPTSLSFSTTLGQTSAAQAVTVRNTGGGMLTVSGAVSTNATFSVANGCSAPLAANATCTINVSFAPTAISNVTGTLNITHNAMGSPSAVTLSGTGVSNVPIVSASTASLSYSGVTAVGQQSASQRVTFNNAGPGAATISSIAPNSEFPVAAATTGSCSAGSLVTVGSSCFIDVRFSPAGAGARSGTMTINSNGSPAAIPVALAGTGSAVAVASVSYLPAGGPIFSPTDAGKTSGSIIVTVSNKGSAPMVLGATGSAAITTGFNPTDFKVASNQCQGMTLQPNADTCTVEVVFAPAAAGLALRTAILMMTYAGGTDQVPLSGVTVGATGVVPPTTTTTTAASAPAATSGGAGSTAWQWLGVLLLAMLCSSRRWTRVRPSAPDAR